MIKVTRKSKPHYFNVPLMHIYCSSLFFSMASQARSCLADTTLSEAQSHFDCPLNKNIIVYINFSYKNNLFRWQSSEGLD